MVDNTIFSLNIWDVLQKEGKAALEKGDLESAAKDFKMALDKAAQFGSTDPRIATSKRYLAGVYHKQGKDDDAEVLFKEAIELQEKQLGTESNALIKTLVAYKNMLSDLGRSDDVEQIKERLVTMQPQSSDTDLAHTTDVFTVDVPEDPAATPMTASQATRIRELLKSVPADLSKEAADMLDKRPTFQEAYAMEEKLRKKIVENYNGEEG